MKLNLRVKVNNHDIKHGGRGSCSDCPVARAILRAFRAKYRRTYDVDVTVGNYEIRINALSKTKSISVVMWGLPKRVKTFIYEFDCGGRTENHKPFSFVFRGI